MARIFSQQLEVLLGKRLDLSRHSPVALPKSRARSMVHSSVDSPARCSRIAASAKLSNCPAETSASNRLSQFAGSNPQDHSRNFARSSGGNLEIECSSSSSVIFTFYHFSERAATCPRQSAELQVPSDGWSTSNSRAETGRGPIARMQTTPAIPADMNAPIKIVGNCHPLPCGSTASIRNTVTNPASTATGIAITIPRRRWPARRIVR